MQRFLVLTIFVFLCLSAPLHAEAFELFGGAVVDHDRSSILVMQPGSGIAVLDTATGEQRCSTRHAARPLLVRGDRMLGQTESGGNVLRLYVFEYRRAASSSASASCELIPLRKIRLPLPIGVLPAIDERIDSAFDVQAEADGAAVLVRWSYRESPAFPDSYAQKGAFRVNLDTAEATPAEPAAAARVRRVLPPVPSATPHKVAQPTGAVAIGIKGRTDGSRSVELTRESNATGKPIASTTLPTGDVRALRLSSDDRSLLVSSLDPATDPARRWVWSIHALDSWNKIGEVRAGRSGSPFFVHDAAVLYREDRTGDPRNTSERPVRLIAQSLSDSRELWSYPVRDTAYRGTRAPKQPGDNLKPEQQRALREAAAKGGAR